MASRKRKPKLGRPLLGDAKRSVVVTIKLRQDEYDAIAAAVDRENAEIEANPLADNEDRKPATVSGWIRDHALDPLGLATFDPD